MANGYMGRILRINLSSQTISTIKTSDYEEFGGGHGLGTAVFWDLCKDKTVKFSDPGKCVTVTLAGSPHGVLLTVGDQGRGFSTEHITKVGAYMQFDRRLQEQQGPGLGLVIAKRLTELHGGTLSIQSERGARTTITVRFPKVSVV